MRKHDTARHATAAGTLVVSATSLDPAARPRGMVRPTVPNYALRRLAAAVVAVVMLFVGAIGAVGLVAGLGGAPAAASGAPPAAASAPALHVADSGDTMWAIAGRYRGSVAHARYLDALIALNGTTAVQAGQAVWLP
ncbi:MAG: LysM peptidoglycan-binding domain-containing protein [Ilumatobacter sp.]|nr:LysM peptidoglycan-binding domain-containing protein [Ilumatobacter sp.]